MSQLLRMDKPEICKSTRKIASEALRIILEKILKQKKPVSEIEFRDLWLKELRKHKEIFPDGWYTPPPHGMGVLFAKDNDTARLKFKSLRHEEFWPRKDIFLNKRNGIVMVYASLVNRKSGIIGDFGMTLYFGKDKAIQKELKDDIDLVMKTFNFIRIGMKLSEIHKFLVKQSSKVGFVNDWWLSTTDPTGTNFGHTIPATNFDWSNEEKETLKKGDTDWESVVKMINQKRKFTNAFEQTVIQEGMALTIEPRLIVKNKPQMPTVYFHTIALFKKNGKKELLTNFNGIFKLTGMGFMLAC